MFNGYQLSKKVRSGGDEIPRLVSGLGTSEQLLTTPWCVRTGHTGRMRAEEAAEWLEHAGLTRCWRKEPLCSLLRRNLWEPRRVVWEDLGYLGFCSVRAARGEQKSRRAAKTGS